MTRISLTQLASLSEDVLEKASQNPTTARLVQGATQAKDRVDDLTKRVRGLEAMEKRIAELEERAREARGREEALRPQGGPEPDAPPPASSERHANPQRPRHDLECRRRRPDLLALELDRQPLVRIDLHVRACGHLHLRVRGRACPCRSSARSSGSRPSTDVADQDDVEQPVVRRRVRARASSRRRARRRSRRSRRAFAPGARRRRSVTAPRCSPTRGTRA